MMAEIFGSPFSMSASTSCLNRASCSATAALSAIMALAQFASEPTARNSKRLPVKANGEVRLRSVLSISSSGICGMSSFIPCLPASETRSSLPLSSIWSSTCVSCLPRKEEMMAGGASLAPRRWALVALMIEAFSKPLWWYTAIRVLTMKVMKRRLSSAVLPGAISRTPVSVPSDQLLCFPEPLTPLKGFSCSNRRKPWLRATLRMSDMMSMLWSTARLHSSKMGASSNWLGATSLWRVLTGMPSSSACISRSFIKAATRVGMAPK